MREVRAGTVILRRMIAWWLERAAERRNSQAQRIYNWAGETGVKLSGMLDEVDLHARQRMKREYAAAGTFRAAAKWLRNRA